MAERKRMTGEQRRESILDAALELFAEQGFAASSTRELAARAGITEPLIYRHFQNKEAILRALFQRESFLPGLRQFDAEIQPAPLPELLLELCRRWRQFMLTHQAQATLVLREMHHSPEIKSLFRDTVQEGMALAARAIRAHADMSGYRPERLETAVQLLFSSLIYFFQTGGQDFLADEARLETRLTNMVALLADGMRREE